jgi:hypothetical protein
VSLELPKGTRLVPLPILSVTVQLLILLSDWLLSLRRRGEVRMTPRGGVILPEAECNDDEIESDEEIDGDLIERIVQENEATPEDWEDEIHGRLLEEVVGGVEDGRVDQSEVGEVSHFLKGD